MEEFIKGYGFEISKHTRNWFTHSYPRAEYYDDCYFSVDSLMKFFNKNKRYLTKKEKEIVDELNAVRHQLYTSYRLSEYEKIVSTRLKRDIKEDIISKYDGLNENNVKTIIGNIINKKTGLPIGYFFDYLKEKGYILYSPNVPWEATTNEKKLKTKEDIDKVLNKIKEELEISKNNKIPQNDNYSFEYARELRPF